jgi:hypothetical protein
LPSSGDQNPVFYIGLIVAIRAWLALFYTSISAITGFESNILNWLSIFVIGVIPGVPTVVNVLLFVLLNGTLLVYLILLLKRIANPVAN